MKFLKGKNSYGEAVKILFIFDNLTKILNFAKNIIIAAALGFTKIPDAYNLSRSINGTFYGTLTEALLAGSLPHLNEREDIQEKINFLYSLIIVVISFFTIISLVLFIFFPNIMDLLAPGFTIEQKRLVFIFFLLQLPMSFLTVFSYAFESYFRSEQIFGIVNVVKFIVAIIAFSLMFFFIKNNFYFLALGPLIGTVIGFLFLLSQIPKKMTKFDPKVIQLLRFALPLILGGSFTIINSFVDKGFSSTLPVGQLTTLDLSMRLVEQIKGLIAGPLVGALYAFLSLSITRKNYKVAQQQLSQITDNLITLFSLVFILFILFGKFALSIMFQHGIVNSDDINLLYEVTLISFPVCFSLVNVLVMVMYSFKNSKIVTISGIFTTLLNVFLNFVFVKVFGIYALASATLFVVLLNALIISLFVKHKYNFVTYTWKHFIIIFTSIVSCYLIIIFDIDIYISTIFILILIGELLAFRLITMDKILSLKNKVIKRR
ncbi:lipid II flippase MurJ [Thiospirochaeta perfilievii]|uniref:lipid II flippase MurJ n=1 Tax=Thiospirochaeta perfilievii TaxID=252967 RepID=UPI0016598854|nr:lipid II flippase MurJ [Thiospirochaeta perfilievii]